MNIFIRSFVPILLITSGLGGYFVLNSMSPAPTEVAYKPQTPPVTVTTAMTQTVSIPVYSRGLISPGSELQIVTEVAGRVIKVSSNFASGGFFKKDELLLEVDATRYKLQITKAEARLISVQQAYDRLIANQGLDDDEVNGIKRSKKFKKAQQREALANVNAAKADVKIANNQIAKAKVFAPFDGRVREAFIGRGQYVTPGMQIARVYAVDQAEVRLPLSDHQLSLVNAPVRYQGQDAANEGPPVTLQLAYAGQNYLWSGKVVRTEGGIDMRNRLIYIVAQIEGPYERDSEQPGRPPLSAGQFVEAQVQGKEYSNVVVLPRKVLRNGDKVWIVDSDERLQKRSLGILHKGRELVYIASGLQPGDQVVVTRLDVAIEGMRVRSTHEDNLDIVDSGSNVVAKGRDFNEELATDTNDSWPIKQRPIKQAEPKKNSIHSNDDISGLEQNKEHGKQASNISNEIELVRGGGEHKFANLEKRVETVESVKNKNEENDVKAILDRIAAKANLENNSAAYKNRSDQAASVKKPQVESTSPTAHLKNKPSQKVATNDIQVNRPQVNSKGAAEAVIPRLLEESAQ
ncbi:MAG: efflux RND transporter periplasmic adaptor subunit [Pseudomonadales bacterium]|nr:efflux RND transporter periplasmic adaptor subunit [Pseudomonadales bacterium]